MSNMLNYTEDEIKKISQGLLSGLTIADVTNTDQQTLDALYSLAYNLYMAQEYDKAETVFKALCTYKHNEEKYWMGFAGCRQALEKYAEAIDAYSIAGFAGALQNPVPFFYAAKCFLKMGDRESTIGSLKSLLTMGDDNNQEHKMCKEKAAELLKLLEDNKQD